MTEPSPSLRLEPALARALEDLADRADPPPPAFDVATAVRARIEREHEEQLGWPAEAGARARGRRADGRRPLRPSIAVAAAVVVAIVGIGVVAPAGWLHRPVDRNPRSFAAAGATTPPPVPSSDATGDSAGISGRRTTIAAIEEHLSFTLLVPHLLGAPDAVIDQSRPGDTKVLLVYEPDGRASAVTGSEARVAESDVGDDYSALPNPTAVRAGEFTGLWYPAPGKGVVFADGNGWLSGQPVNHFNILLWQQDGVTMRLDSKLDQSAAIAVATSMEPATVDHTPRNLA